MNGINKIGFVDYDAIKYHDLVQCKDLDHNQIITEFNKLKNNDCTKINNQFIGNKIIYSIFLNNMLETRRGTKPILREIMNDDQSKKKLIDNCIKYNRRKNMKYLEAVDLYEGFRFLNGSINTFKSSIVRYMINREKGTKYLDPCMGWGGRYLGARSLGIEYYGIDTNISLINGYEKLLNITDGDTIKEELMGCTILSSNNTYMLFGDCLKNGDHDMDGFYNSCEYDFVLTSPPYLNVEVYENMERFTCNKSYYVDFLIPMINKCLKHIQNNGSTCINISEYIYKDYLLNGGVPCKEMIELPQQKGGKKNKEFIYIFKSIS
jgi:hypothetical protein